MNFWTFLHRGGEGLALAILLGLVIVGGTTVGVVALTRPSSFVHACQDETFPQSKDAKDQCSPGATMRVEDKRVFCSCAKADGGT